VILPGSGLREKEVTLSLLKLLNDGKSESTIRGEELAHEMQYWIAAMYRRDLQ
jgi:hypothetical protein